MYAQLFLILLLGCTPVSEKMGLSEVQEFIRKGSSQAVPITSVLSQEMIAKIDSLLLGKLTLDAAVQIALLNNPSIQVIYKDLDIAYADVIQAGMLENPTLNATVLYSEEGTGQHTEFSIEQNVLDILLLPLRKKLAREEYNQVKLQVGDAVLEIINETKTAFFILQANQQLTALQKDVLRAAEAAEELAARQFEAGNINTLDLASHQAALHDAKLEWMRNEAELFSNQENLHRLMGLTGANPKLNIEADLSKLPLSDPDLSDVIRTALAQRLDLAAVQQELVIFKKALFLARTEAVPDISGSMVKESSPDENPHVGPGIELDIPLFDRGQANVARLKAQLSQSKKQIEVLKQDIRSEIRIIHNQMDTKRKAVEYYRDIIIPVHEDVVQASQLEYNFMLLGAYTLLQVKQDEINARRNYILTLRDYWIFRTELERAVGAGLINI